MVLEHEVLKRNIGTAEAGMSANWGKKSTPPRVLKFIRQAYDFRMEKTKRMVLTGN
jgi:hypothetical protein